MIKKMKVLIYQPAKSSTQSKRNEEKWHIRFPYDNTKFAEKIMGWIGTRDTIQQLNLSFDDLYKAKEFCEKNNWDYVIQEPHKFFVKTKSYADNFTKKIL